MVRIEKVTNGYCVTNEEGEMIVFQDRDDDVLAAEEALLWEMIEQFGIRGSRYDKERLVIRREPGDKYEK